MTSFASPSATILRRLTIVISISLMSNGYISWGNVIVRIISMICTECLHLIQILEQLERAHADRVKAVRASRLQQGSDNSDLSLLESSERKAREEVEAARRELKSHQRNDAVRKMSTGFVQGTGHYQEPFAPLY